MATIIGDERACKGHRRGTHRLVEPRATFERVAPMRGRMGITRVANVTGLDRIGLPVVMVCRPNSRSIAVSQGKGLDLDAAKASGLMEAVELWHAERIGLPLRLGSFEEVSEAHRVIDLAALPQIADSRFRPSLPMLWIDGRDLLSAAPVLLPYEIVHTNYTLPLPPGSGCFPASSNGLASGNHLLEAINHAICEIVERDAMSVWHHVDRATRDGTRVDLGTIDDDPCREILGRLERAEFAAAVWDTTTNVGIPSFYCLIVDRRREAAHSGAGAGSHPSREVALLRALTEAIQVRTTYITGSRDDLHPEEFTPPGIERKLRGARALMEGGGGRRDFRQIPTFESETFADDLAWMLARLRAAGVKEVVAIDLTRPDLGIPVARLVIPGLEGADDHDRYVPGPRALAARGTSP